MAKTTNSTSVVHNDVNSNNKVEINEAEIAFESILINSLQPLQDLAKNWDIDVSSCLEEYLLELHEINPAAVVHTLNNPPYDTNNDNDDDRSCSVPFSFAQAALVVQNSSHVYGRKVDFLYKLVYKHLEELVLQTTNENSTNKHNSRSRQRGKDVEVDDFLNYDPYQDFLLLDDVLPTVDRNDKTKKSSMIDLNEDYDDCEDGFDGDNNRRPRRSSSSSLLLPSNISKTRLSLGALAGTTTNTNYTTADGISFQGAGTIAMSTTAAHRALIGSLEKNNCLRLSHDGGCDIGDNGILLMPGTTHLLPEGFHAIDNSSHVNIERSQGTVGNNDETQFSGEYNFDDGIDDHDECVGFQLAPDTNSIQPTVPTSLTSALPVKRITFDAANTSEKTNNQLVRTERSSTVATTSSVKLDPWELLDPHIAYPMKSRPLRVGKTLIVPPELGGLLPSDCVTGSSTITRRHPQHPKQPKPPHSQTALGTSNALMNRRSLAMETFQATMARRRKRTYADSNETNSCVSNMGTAVDTLNNRSCFTLPLRGLVFGSEFAYIARAVAKRRSAEQRANRKQLLQQNQRSVNDRDDDFEVMNDHFNTNMHKPTTFGAVTNSDYNDYDDYDDDDHNNDGGDYVGGFGSLGSSDNHGINGDDESYSKRLGPVETNTGLMSIDEVFNGDGDDHDADDPDNHTRYYTFEELCRAHIQKFAVGAEKYAVETKLTQRVDQWQSKLVPILDEEERRSTFDIHLYGVTVVESIEKSIMRKLQRRNRHRHNQTKSDLDLLKKPDMELEGPTTTPDTCAIAVDFRDVTMDCPPYEVCRLFLASLSLCNSGNVVFANTDTRDNPSSSLDMHLLKKDIGRPIDSYNLS